MRSQKISLLLLISASVLVSLGDLRNLITPFGYWLAWAIWLSLAAVSVAFFKHEPYSYQDHAGIAQSLLLLGFGLLLSGFSLSALYNADYITLYQIIKMTAICAIGEFIYKHSNSLSHQQLASISFTTIAIAFLLFATSKYVFPASHVQLGDGRQGSLIAYPGVLWKTGAFFSPFALAYFLSERKNSVTSLLAYLAGAFLVIIDGSRTGILWLTFSTTILIGIRTLDYKRAYSFQNIILAGLAAATLSISAAFLASAPDTINFALALDRISSGDPTRINMLADGLTHAEQCLALGCGFGSAVSATPEGPMVIHNAFLAVLGDIGILGFIGLLVILASPLLALLAKLSISPSKSDLASAYFISAATLGVMGFMFTLLFHPLSTEMSEWGLFFIMASWIFSKSREANFKAAPHK